MNDEALMAEMIARSERTDAIMTQLREDNPGLPTITCIIMAGDIDAGNQADIALRAGEIGWSNALTWCGSYSRCDMAVRWVDDGLIPRDALLDQWPHLWSGSDPDDTDPRFLDVWREARIHAGKTVVDGDPLPHTRSGRLTVYRGQMPDDAVFGIAWSLSRETAMRFANGVGVRAHVDGVLYRGGIEAKRVLGYLTDRGEREVVLNPADLKDVRAAT